MDLAMEMYEAMFEAYGPQHWWPGDSPFEILVGAMLTQQAAWHNVEMAISSLKSAGKLDMASIHRMGAQTLERHIRPSGYFRQKAKRLKGVIGVLVKEWDGDLEAFLSRDVDVVRRELLAMHGIGKETADSILLYAAGKPVFVIDAYTKRVCGRVGVDSRLDYDSLQGYFMSSLPEDVGLYNEYHALFVRHGKEHCRTRPACAGCPLEEMCRHAEGG